MPLVRFPVRNEYGLGHPALYKDADNEDPKAVLDGVAVTGLVGILRQLGDLAEFAAEVFHGLQEQVMATASRSHKLMVRVQCIEAALPPLEKAVLAQTSHIHFAYTAGSEWHPRIRNEQNHFVYNDLPRFIMDTYEECRNPPRLHLLDKFDAGGPGSCLKRYSDPTFFRRLSGSSIEVTADKIQRDKKACKKKKKSSQRNGEILRVTSISNHSGRMHLTSPAVLGRISTQSASTVDMILKSDLGDHSNSFDSRTGSGYIECVSNLGSTMQPGQQRSKDTSSGLTQDIDTHDSVFCDEPTGMVGERRHSSSPEQIAPSSSCVSWDEKAEIVEPKGPECDIGEVVEVSANLEIDDRRDRQTANHGIVDQMDIMLDRKSQEVRSANFDINRRDRGTANLKNVEHMNIFPADEDTRKSFSDGNQLDEIESEPDNYVDALNTIESESENDLDCQTKQEVEQYSSSVNNCRVEDGIHEILAHSSDQYPSDIESHTVSGISESNGMPCNLPNSVPSESIFHELTPQISGRSFDSNHSPHIVHEQTPQISGRSSHLDHSPGIVLEQTPQISGKSSDSDLSPGIVHEQTPKISGRFSDSDHSPGLVHEQTPLISGKSLDSDHSPGIVHEQTSQIAGRSSDSDHSPGIVHEQTPQISGKSSVSDHSQGTDICASDDILDGSKVESVINDGPKVECLISDPSSSVSRTSDLHDRSGDRIISSFYESQQSHAESSSSTSVKFWTNGGLLGLQPSKPPDFCVSNATSQDDVARSKFSPTNTTPKGDEQKQKIDTLVENAESSKKVSASNLDKVPVPLADSDSKLDKCSDSHGSNRFNHAHGGGVDVNAIAASRAEFAPHVNATSTEASQDNDNNSSLVFGLGHRLLANGFRRKLSVVPDYKSEPVSSLETGVIDQERGHHHDACQTISQMTFMDRFGSGPPLGSLTSSPPLEHMKISFNPVDGFETSKLKLKFSEGNECTGSTRDMFPSFQLVPEPAIPLHDYASDSDDDTFCRSSPYMSDDCASHHSKSNSEQWESSPGGSIDHELYDALCRMSSMESVSSSLQIEGAAKNGMHADHGLQSICHENGAEPCLSCLDLPSFDAVDPVLQGETKTDSDTNNLPKLLNPAEPTPLLPPLPPGQWQVLKPQLDEAEDKQYAVSDALMRALEQKLLGSSVSQQPEPAPADQQFTNKEAVAFRRESKGDQQKLHGKKEINQNANGKGLDEKDFLHQIRTKSFSLRPTVTARPTFSSAPSGNVKVTAILEKANAIRQAVASDDGEDYDKWSDT